MGTIWVGESNGCWIDVWDDVDFKGHYQRLFGPTDFPYMRFGDRDWATTLQSLRVGPGAYVQCYEDLNVPESVFWLLPGQVVPNVAALDCGDEIDSMRIFDRPPFAREPGYTAYMLWAAHHLQLTSARGEGGPRADGGTGTFSVTKSPPIKPDGN